MNKILNLVLAVLLALCSATESYGQEQEVEAQLQFNRNDFVINKTGNKVSVSSTNHDFGYVRNLSSLAIPYEFANVSLPCSAEYESLRYVVTEKELVYSNVEIEDVPIEYPTYGLDSQEVPENTDDNPANVNGTQSVQGILYLATTVGKEGTIFHFIVPPFEYDSASKNLYLRKNINLTVSYKKTVDTKNSPVGYNPELMEAITKINNVPQIGSSSNSGLYDYQTDVNISNDDKDIDYVIITNNSLAESFLNGKHGKLPKE